MREWGGGGGGGPVPSEKKDVAVREQDERRGPIHSPTDQTFLPPPPLDLLGSTLCN